MKVAHLKWQIKKDKSHIYSNDFDFLFNFYDLSLFLIININLMNIGTNYFLYRVSINIATVIRILRRWRFAAIFYFTFVCVKSCIDLSSKIYCLFCFILFTHLLHALSFLLIKHFLTNFHWTFIYWLQKLRRHRDLLLKWKSTSLRFWNLSLFHRKEELEITFIVCYFHRLTWN